MSIAPAAPARPSATTTDEALLVASASGDQEAYAALYRRQAPRLQAIAQRVVRDRTLAEEVVQEVLLEAWSKAHTFDPDKGSAAGWLSTLTRRRAVDRVRSEQAARDRDQRVGHRDRSRDVDVVADAVATNLDHDEVRVAMATLTDRQREAVSLAYWGGHTYRQVARILAIPEGTAKSRLRDAMGRLRVELEPAI